MSDAANPSSASIPTELATVFNSYAEPVRTELLELRDLILATAAETDGVGALSEALRWGEPSYLTDETRSGSTIRIAPTRPGTDHDDAMFFICHTTLVDSIKQLFGDTFAYDGERALLFRVGEQRPEDELRECIAMALTYHLAKQRVA